jgi:hypothetical protein
VEQYVAFVGKFTILMSAFFVKELDMKANQCRKTDGC